MKSSPRAMFSPIPASLPSRGAWIEIALLVEREEGAESLPSRGAWIEIVLEYRPDQAGKSLPSRGAWIEITITLA